MTVLQQWGKLGISCSEDGWYGERELTFVQAAVVAQGIASYRKATSGTRHGMIVGYTGDRRGYLFAERIAEVLVGNGMVAWLCEQAAGEGQLRHAIGEQRLDGGILVTTAHNRVQGLKFLAPISSEFSADQIAPYVREIERGERPLQVKPYAQATREGALLLCAFQI